MIQSEIVPQHKPCPPLIIKNKRMTPHFFLNSRCIRVRVRVFVLVSDLCLSPRGRPFALERSPKLHQSSECMSTKYFFPPDNFSQGFVSSKVFDHEINFKNITLRCMMVYSISSNVISRHFLRNVFLSPQRTETISTQIRRVIERT